MKQARMLHQHPRLFHLIWFSRILAKQTEAFRRLAERAIRNQRGIAGKYSCVASATVKLNRR